MKVVLSQEGEWCSLVTRIGIAGTGFIGKGITHLLIHHHPDLVVHSILTRRSLPDLRDAPAADRLTNSIDQMVDSCDLIVECSGDVLHATDVVSAALLAGKPVVTMNAEFHVTTGSYFVNKGYLTEAEGDQPGCLAALREEAIQMGFKPLVYGNMKGYLNLNPTQEDMTYWADRQGFSTTQTTAFTDGTKLQIEQALIGNFTDATIMKQGLLGPSGDDLAPLANQLSAIADASDRPIVDYVLSRKLPSGVFITATHDECQRLALRNYRFGDGPYYTILRPHHLCAIEAVKTIRRAIAGIPVLLDNSVRPKLSVAAIAKRRLKQGETIDDATGGFMVRGETVKVAEEPCHVPIGILKGTRLLRNIEPGQCLSWSDIEPNDCLATQIAQSLFCNSNNDTEQESDEPVTSSGTA